MPETRSGTEPFLSPPEAASVRSAPGERELRQKLARQEVVERRRIVLKLRQALADRRLCLYFQPIFSLETGRAQGAEAQLRLAHSRRGLIPAGHFLPLAEQSEVIIEVGGWMLREACREAARLPGELRVALALSWRHLRSGRFVRHLLEALHHSGIAPERLELLVTETMLLDENDDAAFALKALRGVGVRLALNHFGTGYASLAPLKRLPFTSLRLDASLVRNMDGEAAGAALAQAAVEAGHALGCTVLADGIETAAQYETLRALRADEGQGGYFGPALPGEELAGRLRAR
ncbi:EAL domain-containing protein [Acidocella sp.]|uniref:EAL domain-containing protein n=1 Tax=Acidocella sp. TaxID=50710 RepID=UPI00263511A2|nr:EAL domain-containing protein [Acidocella sp.]